MSKRHCHFSVDDSYQSQMDYLREILYQVTMVLPITTVVIVNASRCDDGMYMLHLSKNLASKLKLAQGQVKFNQVFG